MISVILKMIFAFTGILLSLSWVDATRQSCVTSREDLCFITAPQNTSWTCQTGIIQTNPPVMINCLTTGCSIGLFSQEGFLCFCKEIPIELQIEGNQIYLDDGSCCPENNGYWTIIPVISS